jgi:uncharacterized membrane protein YidH (DUF202 family)
VSLGPKAVQIMKPTSGRPEIRNLLKGVLVVLSGALMILPAYLNYEIFRLHFELVVSLSISIILFALGMLVFILVLGKEAFEGKQ